jgi:hypothetical protein
MLRPKAWAGGLGRLRVYMHNKNRWRARYLAGEVYVWAWTIGILYIARHAVGHSGTWYTGNGVAQMMGGIAAYRLWEILTTQARIVVDDPFNGYEHTDVSIVRYLIFVPLYYAQVILIFTTFYILSAPRHVTQSAATFTSFLRLSVGTITTLGSGTNAPVGTSAQLFEIGEVAEGLLLVALGLPMIVGAVRLRRS